MINDQEQYTVIYRKPTEEQRRQPIDRYQEMTLQYNYRRDLREACKPKLYGPGVDLYEEEQLRARSMAGGDL